MSASRTFRQEAATGSRRPSRPAAWCALWPAGAPPVSGAGRRDHRGAGADELSGLRRRGRSDRRGVAVSGRPTPGAPAGGPLRHRGRPLLAVSAAYPGPARPADLRRARGGPRTARSRRGRAGRGVAHPRRPAAGQGRRPAADPLRPAGDAGGPRESAASCGTRRDAGLRGVARAGSQRLASAYNATSHQRNLVGAWASTCQAHYMPVFIDESPSRVERRRRGYRPWVGPVASFRATPQSHRPYPVSCERSSNRASRFPAHGSRTGFTPRHATGPHDALRPGETGRRARRPVPR